MKPALVLAPSQWGFTSAHVFCGMGGDGEGFATAEVEFLDIFGRFRVVGGIEIDPIRAKEFTKRTGAPCYTLDLFPRREYIAYHSKFKDLEDESLTPLLGKILVAYGRMRSPGRDHKDGLVKCLGKRYWYYRGTWAEVVKFVQPIKPEITPADVRAYFGPRRPDVLFLSPPCQGLSGLQPTAKAESWMYMALNELVPHGLALFADAYIDDPIPVIVLENVPRIKQRGATLLDRTQKVMKTYDYAVKMDTYNCGKWGNMCQDRPRFKALFRHEPSVSQFIYEPYNHRLRPIKEDLWPLPLPGDIEHGGPLNEPQKLSWNTQLRLALIRKGKDHKDIPEPGHWCLVTADGREVPDEAVAKSIKDDKAPDPGLWGRAFFALRLTTANSAEARLQYDSRNGAYRVGDPNQASTAIIASASPRGSNGISAVAEARLPDYGLYASKMRVLDPNRPSQTLTANDRIGSGAFAISEERPPDVGLKHSPRDGSMAVADGDKPFSAIGGNMSVTKSNIPAAVAEIRLLRQPRSGVMTVLDPDRNSNTVTPGTDPNGNGLAIAEARMKCKPHNGIMGVLDGNRPSGVMLSSADVYAGAFAVADDRDLLPPWCKDFVILSIEDDGRVSNHRGMTDLEMLVLQSFRWQNPDGTPMTIEGTRKDRRSMIGNAVPPAAARAFAEMTLRTLIWACVRPDYFMLSPLGTPVLVKPDEEIIPLDLSGD